jgi:transposase
VARAQLVITAITKQGLTQAEAARTYALSEATVSRIMARYREEGEAAFQPRSRRPHRSPKALDPAVVELILRLRKQLAEDGLDAGPETIAWHLEHNHGHRVSRSTISRHLTAAGLVTPEPRKRPKSSYIRFEAAMPNQTWQSDFTHYRLATGVQVEIITWLDDCTRYALHITAHPRNGMVYTVRHAGLGRQGGRNGFEALLRVWGVIQKNSRPSHPTTCGKVERFQQTLKKWLTAQPDQPATIDQL